MDKNELKLDLKLADNFIVPDFHKQILAERRDTYDNEKPLGSIWEEVKKRVTSKH